MFDDDIWDEYRWEQFLRENDRRLDHYTELMYGFLSENPRPSPDEPRAVAAWKRELRDFMEAKGWGEDDLPCFLFEEDEGETYDEESGEWVFDFDQGYLDDEELMDDIYSIERLPVYQNAYELVLDVLQWADELPAREKGSALVQFCSCVAQIPAKIAKGHGMGYDRDMLGGNIACVKRSLGAANKALVQLRDLRAAPYMTNDKYFGLYEQLFEVRNEIGLYVQELRERFDLGID